MSDPTQPPMKVVEIKRRTRALIKAARDEGLVPVGVEMDESGKIRVLDKDAIPANDGTGEWV